MGIDCSGEGAVIEFTLRGYGRGDGQLCWLYDLNVIMIASGGDQPLNWDLHREIVLLGTGELYGFQRWLLCISRSNSFPIGDCSEPDLTLSRTIGPKPN